MIRATFPGLLHECGRRGYWNKRPLLLGIIGFALCISGSFLACQKQESTEITEQQKMDRASTVVMNREKSNATLALVSGHHVLLFCGSGVGTHGPRRDTSAMDFMLAGYGSFLQLAARANNGYEHLRLQQNEFYTPVNLDDGTPWSNRSWQFFITADQNVVTVHDGDQTMKMMLFSNVLDRVTPIGRARGMGRDMEPNTDVYYLSLRDRQIVLANGFRGTADIKPFMPPFPTGVEADVVLDSTVVAFGNEQHVQRMLGRRKLVDISVGTIDYLCIGHQGLGALARDLHMSLTETEYPFLLMLTPE